MSVEMMYLNGEISKHENDLKQLKQVRNEIMQRDIKTLEVYTDYFHSHLDQLSDYKRSFVDERVKADKYYLIYNHGLVIGGFATKTNGWVSGFFTLVKGYSDIFLDTVIKQARIDSDAYFLHLLCCGRDLKTYYSERGWSVESVAAWDESLKHKLWNKDIQGQPSFYTMSIGEKS